MTDQELSPEEARRAAAADWLQQLDDPTVSEAQMQSWLEWFGASDENRRAFEEMQTLYREMRALPTGYRERARQLARVSVPARSTRSTRLAVAAALTAVAIGGVTWWQMESAVFVSEPMVYVAPAERHRAVQLNDGSELALGADSIVAVSYSADLRAVAIERGQAYFEVEKDAERPFVVSAGDVRVTAMGTAFNVVRERRAVTVTVTAGIVEVARIVAGAADAPIRISIGEKRVIALGDAQTLGSTPRGDRTEGGWNEGRVEFVESTLSKVLPLVNQHARRQLVIDDPRVADLTYSGTILQEHVEEWVASLPHIYPIRPVALEDGTTTLVMTNDKH